jgi:hypothetical protein
MLIAPSLGRNIPRMRDISAVVHPWTSRRAGVPKVWRGLAPGGKCAPPAHAARGDEPRIDVSARVLDQLQQMTRVKPSRRPVRLAVAALALVAAGLLVAGNGNVRRTVQRVGALVSARRDLMK